MTQPDLTPAGICANIEHYRCVWIEQNRQIKHTENELAFWLAIQKSKEHNGTGHTS
jgi:hypothetical protein